MKNLVLLFMFVTFSLSAQYDRWAGELNMGFHTVGDESAIVTDAFNHYGASLRYSLNPTVSLGLSGGYDNLTLEDLGGAVSETDYMRLSAEMFVDVFDILNLQNNTFTVLAHGGAGVSQIIADNGYKEPVFSTTAGAKGLFKLNKSLALTLGYRYTGNYAQGQTLDGYQDVTNADVNSTVSNFTLGATFYIGKEHSHADWYVEPVAEPNVYVLKHIIEKTPITNVVNNVVQSQILEFVFFDHDKDIITPKGLNAITKIYNALSDSNELIIKGFASATDSSDEYNLDLSKRRCLAVWDKLSNMGADMDKVSIDAQGKDFNWSDEGTHDVSRRVELIIKN